MLELNSVTAEYVTPRGLVRAVSDVSLVVKDNEILGLAGESGSGKSSLLKIMYGNIRSPMRIIDGDISLKVHNAQGLETKFQNVEIQKVWWKRISYVPQGAMSVLNPVTRIGPQFMDAIPRSEQRSKREIRERIISYLRDLQLSADVLQSFPHQLSGGMRQRILIAMATFLHPSVVLADEPTTALDVVVQRNILLMLSKLQQRMGNSLVIVSHDMGVHYQITHRLAIMYAGRIVEIGPTQRVFDNPLHPYAAALIGSLPRIGDDSRREGLGLMENDDEAITGCQFYKRCPLRKAKCKHETPPMLEVEAEHFVECHLYS